MAVTEQRSGPRFRVDDFVYFSANSMTGRVPTSPERFVIVAVMPQDRAGAYQYRIKPMETGPHRVVTELELRR
jgi:hypothetical protein